MVSTDPTTCRPSYLWPVAFRKSHLHSPCTCTQITQGSSWVHFGQGAHPNFDHRTQPVIYTIANPYTGWWYTYPSEKYEFVSWDDDIPNICKNKNVPNHQPVYSYQSSYGVMDQLGYKIHFNLKMTTIHHPWDNRDGWFLFLLSKYGTWRQWTLLSGKN